MSTFPAFYQPDRIGSLFYPDMTVIAADADKAQLKESFTDSFKLRLLIIDMQIDFCHPSGALYVPGAEEDIRRLIEFIYRYARRISSITCSLDSHLPYQIFHPVWWCDRHGRHPAPFTTISTADIEKGVWQPQIAPVWSKSYIDSLHSLARKDLVIWPYHVPIGGIGNAMEPELWSAVLWHSIARRSQPTWLVKGNIPGTEHYSIFKPEVPVADLPQEGMNEELIADLRNQDAILVAGEAESHCVLASLTDLVEAFQDDQTDLNRIYVLQDCMSPVLHPEVDFHGMALEQFSFFRSLGVNFINSTDPLPF